jgi:hypothetical protein
MEEIGERLKTEFPQRKLTQRMQDLLHQLDEAERLAKFRPVYRNPKPAQELCSRQL